MVKVSRDHQPIISMMIFHVKFTRGFIFGLLIYERVNMVLMRYIIVYHNYHNHIGTLWLFNIAMGNGPVIDRSPMKNGDFPWLC